ncbi:hypothetical protein BCR32DRAFT_328262 [Anaeromyces robustus]|uniref:Uncharacterized protein n=1 Tax=Anaeromyces robustus TaxID=1754192 RepID=A0A1Y1X038_9FUNG|nr:hypothetical protein BCR32DRAFT_328262 [Anaeromyces robustus]|eukprot:ORX79093.1 hypothetical protein BCR32DRAFT_328262 [Anaeromyces robustus]
MKSSLKTKISHLFKGKSNKLEKFPTYDTSSSRVLDNQSTPRSIETEKLGREKVHGNKKSHKKPKTNLNLIDTKVKKYHEFPVLPSPIHDPNESAKLTAQEFAKAVGIKILHRTDEEEDEECDCEYCRSARFNSTNLNTVSTIDPSLLDEASTPTQQIPNVSLNQLSVNASISSTTNSNASTINDNQNINIPPFPAFNMSFSNDRLNKCSSNTSVSTNSNHSIINSKTIGTPGYHCHRNNRKNSISKVIDMSLFIPPTEEEMKSRVHSSSLSINSTPEVNNIQPCASTEKLMGGSLDRHKNVGCKKNYYGIGVASSMSTRERSISTSIASSSRNNMRMMNNEYRTSPILKESSIGHSSRIQFKQQPFHRCDSGTELSNGNTSTGINTNISNNGNANINPSSPNKRPYPPSLASSSSSTTLSSALSLTHISQPNLNQAPSCSSRSSISKKPISHNNSLQSVKYSPKPSKASTPACNMSPASSNSSITPIKPHNSFKITRSVTISEGTRRAEIDLQPIQQDEIKVYTKGRFTITHEYSRRPSVNSNHSNN